MRFQYGAAAVLAVSLLTSAAPETAAAQRVRRSQPGTVSQTVAQTVLTVTYNRPVARGRALFGQLVKWDEIWNPGADQATYMETTGDISVGGRPLPRGKYSLWVLPRRAGPWTVIFSRAWDVFHVPYPGSEQDALRIDLDPESGDHMEVLAFYFPVVGPDHADLVLHWGETRLAIPIRLD